MLSRIEQTINAHPIALIVFGFLFGFSFQGVSAILNPAILPLIMAVMYIAFLKIDIQVVLSEIKNYTLSAYFLFLTAIIVPTAVYFAARTALNLMSLDPTWAIGPLILFACPTSALAVAFTLMFKGHFERALLNLVLTSLLAPFSMPFLLKILAGAQIDIDYLQMFKILFILVVIPFVAASITIRFFQGLKSKISPHGPTLSILLLVMVEIGSLDGFKARVLEEPALFLQCFLLCVATLTLAYGMGWMLCFQKDPKDRLTSSMLTTWPNMGLSIGIANTFFKKDMPDVLFVLVVMVLPWYFSLVIPKIVSERIQR